MNIFHCKGSFVEDRKVNLEGLAELTRLDLNDLRKLVYHTVADTYDVTIFGQSVSQYLLRPHRPRVCPECLSQSNYCRKQWDLSAVTSCPIHHVTLLEICPICLKPITWYRKAVSYCPCGADWRQAETARLPESESVVSRLIYEACGLIPHPRANSEATNPLYGLNLSSLLSALFLVASQQGGHAAMAKHIFLRRPSADIHRSLLKAYSVFESWPTSFYSFLDRLSSVNRSSRTKRGLRTAFGSFYQRLYNPRYLPAVVGDVLRKEFENYVSEHWDREYVSSPKWLKVRCGNKYVSRAKASTMLKLTAPLLDGLISAGKLKGVVRRTGKRRFFLIEAASVERLILERAKHLSLKAVSKLLGIGKLNVLRLTENSLLTAARGPSVDNHDSWKFDETTVNKFLTSIVSRTAKLTARDTNDLRSFNDVLDTLTVNLSSASWGIHTLVKDILNGLINPRDESPNDSGLSRLCFSRQEVKQYVKTKLADETDERLKLIGGTIGHGFKARAIYFLARKGLIETKSETQGPRRSRIITREAILQFKSNHVAAGRVAREVGTRIDFLIRVLKSHKVYPVSGNSVDGGPQYILRRADLVSLNLKDLVIAFPMLRMDRRKLSHSVDSREAARILSIDKEVIPELVGNGILRPYAESAKATGGYIFNRTYVERLKGQFRNLTDLLSSNAAAKILGVHLTKLHEKWIKRGYLQYETSKNGKKRFLRKSEVEQVASFMRSVATRAQVAVLLGVPWWRVQELTRKRLLKPVANPYPGAFRNLIYSKAHLKKLRG